jgi:hypothetical protein
MQSLSTALYPATDLEYQIQWGTYGGIVKTIILKTYDPSLTQASNLRGICGLAT